MKRAFGLVSCAMLLAHGGPAHAAEQRVVRAQLVHAGYAKKDGTPLPEEGTDQV